MELCFPQFVRSTVADLTNDKCIRCTNIQAFKCEKYQESMCIIIIRCSLCKSTFFSDKMLKSPYLKCEAENFCYRPFCSELDQWPRLNIDTPRGSCPFDGTLIKWYSCFFQSALLLFKYIPSGTHYKVILSRPMLPFYGSLM